MADISDPDVARYLNEVVRPLADRMVGLKLTLDAEIATWNATIAPLLVTLNAQTDDRLLDGSETDGRTTLTYNDLLLFVTQMNNAKADWDVAGVFDVLNKPKVNVIMP